MLKVSKLLDYGLLVVVTIAQNDSNPYSAAKIAESTGLNIPTVRKLLNQLSLNKYCKLKARYRRRLHTS